MDIHAALEEVARWCAEQTTAGNPETMEVDCHATVWITVAEWTPPWEVRWARRSSAGAGAPVAQLRYDAEACEWTLHHGTRGGWCEEGEAVRGSELGPLLDEVASDREGRYSGLAPIFRDGNVRSW
jgi:hypothetical protein